ncbi:MAG: helix-turn-helix transcriptional regulator [Nitrospinaceae bacterium]|jgi:XRE family transcriptional regulator, fatty acid utilization regulator|nr:helix-turn-helix transcriptional regulator [Nitrospinaceae bacterium]
MKKNKLFLREWRKALALSLRGLAELAEVDFAAIDKIERGKRDPRLSTLIALADALGIEVQRLFSAPPERRRGNKQ